LVISTLQVLLLSKDIFGLVPLAAFIFILPKWRTSSNASSKKTEKSTNEALSDCGNRTEGTNEAREC
jgi:hypothetical protein